MTEPTRDDLCLRLARELSLNPGQVRAAAELFDGGATIPFVARYRKEATGGLDEEALAAVRDGLARLAALEKRRAAILAGLAETGKLTPELRDAVQEASTLARLEDLWLPFRPKRRTRASIAREAGLGPLAERLLSQAGFDPLAEAARYVDPERGVADAEAALAGARDIIAEQAAEDPAVREAMRGLFLSHGVLESRVAKGKEAEGAAWRDWFDYREEVRRMPGHRVHAVLRGEREGVLTLGVRPPERMALEILARAFLKARTPAAREVAKAVEDGYHRLLAPAMETEARRHLKERADAEAARVFAANLGGLLMAPPLGQLPVLALDPGYRTGAKLAVLDAQGRLVEVGVVYPTHGGRKAEEAAATVRAHVARHAVKAVAVGDGTASRETEAFARGCGLPDDVVVTLVDEDGASVWSASEGARREFPELDAALRGSASIGRRLQDPLAELVKIPPESVGVGQYQHDVEPKLLARALADTVERCVNAVGVEANSASPELLAHVAGIGPALARNIVAHRDEHGPFRSRAELKKVKGLGPKAFEQAAGFLRIRGAANPLDASAVHPERYALVKRMAADLGATVARLLADPELRARIEPERYVDGDAGLPTVRDILAELEKPGRDPRADFEPFAFADVRELSDLTLGMRLPGVVTNVTAFGAFVDVGVKRDGLVHVSRLSRSFVRDPSSVVRVGQKVTVSVVEVDQERGRISLSLAD